MECRVTYPAHWIDPPRPVLLKVCGHFAGSRGVHARLHDPLLHALETSQVSPLDGMPGRIAPGLGLAVFPRLMERWCGPSEQRPGVSAAGFARVAPARQPRGAN